MNRIMHDIAYAFRKLRGTPYSSLTAILILAIAIGTNTGVYTIVDNLSVVEPSGSNADETLLIGGRPKDPQYTNFFAIDGAFADTIEQNFDAFERIAKVSPGWFTITDIEDPLRIEGLRVSKGFMQIVGVKAELGRVLEDRDFESGSTPGAMITKDIWQRGWDNDESVIDSIVSIQGDPYRIVGILPDSFSYERINLGIVITSTYLPNDFPSNELPYHNFIGLLKNDVNQEQATAQLTGIESQLHGLERYPGYWEYVRLGTKRLNEFENEFLETQMNILLSVGLVILVIAAFNVTNLTLVRLNRRGGEYATRAALGANRFDLFRISVFENGILVFTGFILGIGIGYGLISTITNSFEGASWGMLEHLDSSELSMNWRILAYTGVACLLALIFISLSTLLFSRRNSINSYIKQDTRSSTGNAAFNWTTNSLLFLKVAFTCTLLIVGGFFFNSLSKLGKFDFGFQPEGLSIGNINLPFYRFEAEERPTVMLNMSKSIIESVRTVPGIEDAAFTKLRFPHYGNSEAIRLKDSPTDMLDQDLPRAWRGDVDPNFFELIGLKTLQGETFNAVQNSVDGEKVAVVNQAFVEQHFDGGDAVGEFVSARFRGQYTQYRIIGVVSNIKRWWLPDNPEAPGIYFPSGNGNRGYSWGFLYLKTNYWNAEVERNVYAAIRAVEGETVIFPFTPLPELLETSQNSFRFIVFIQTLVSIIGLLLSSVGIYSAVSNNVAQRKREMGIRLALGAQPRNIRNRILMRSLTLLIPALLLGLAGAFYVISISSILEDQLPLVDTENWYIYISYSIGLLAVGLLATFQPAIHASRTNPNTALDEF